MEEIELFDDQLKLKLETQFLFVKWFKSIINPLHSERLNFTLFLINKRDLQFDEKWKTNRNAWQLKQMKKS